MNLVNCMTCGKRHLMKNSKSFPEFESYFDGNKQIKKNRVLYFCSINCEIKYMINQHKKYGYDDENILQHLSIDHMYMYSDIQKNLITR